MSDHLHTHKANLEEAKTAFSISIAQHPVGESTKDFLLEIKSYIISLNNRSARIHDPLFRVEHNRNVGIDDASNPFPGETDLGDDDFHLVWYMMIEVAKITPLEGNDQDSLVCLLLYFRRLGALARHVVDRGLNAAGNYGVSVWADLPFFASDLLEALMKDVELSQAARNNLAAFTGRCVALGVGGSETTALRLLQASLDMGTADQSTEEASMKMESLLAASAVLLEQCGHHILTLCIENQDTSQEDIQLGQAEMAKAEKLRFTVEQWLFWRHGLQKMCANDNTLIASNAKRGFEAMIGCGRELGFVVEGEGRYFQKVYKALREEMGRSGKTSVGLEDIETDPNWVD